ncbi:MAG: NADH-quinone oxidoreductase subunit NuoF [Anaerolineae bacterium]|nr:NADH-quinone oxidoreductase subunit NuoF [Thermoflexales bacterium]MDW8407939.1 NADH-quinone oxidoreductase subunit NuoF [Anaerolineae bacterium]
MDKHVLLRDLDVPNIRELAVYEANDGYAAWRKALTTMKPEEVIAVVKDSGLRGRGGAGFPAGVKWSFIPKDIFPKYVVVNGDESEAGTFKDHQLLDNNPHQVIEGTALCAYAVQANTAYIYLRGEFLEPSRTLQKAIDEAYAAGLLGKNILGTGFNLDIHIHLGAGAYICGEETALLSSLEGYLGQPRLRPPFPAVQGLYAKPTVINNVETLANVPPIVLHGAQWYRQFGTEKSPGTKIFCVSGRVNKPGNYELPLGKYTIRELIDMAGGTIDNRPVKGVLPAGSSAPILPASALDTKLDYESMQAAGSLLGSASFVILDDTVDIVWAARKMVRFFKHESCGKCTPCREGTHWALALYDKIIEGRGTARDVEMLGEVANSMAGKCFCLLGEFATSPILSTLKHFRPEYERWVTRAQA